MVWNSGWYISTLGFAYSQLNQNDKARYCYKRWLELEPNSARPLYCIGYLEYWDKRWTAALEWFDQALEIDPRYLVCLYRKGVALLQQFKYKQAKDVLKEAVQVWLHHADADWQKRNRKYFYRSVFYLGKAYFGIHSYKNAVRCFRKVLDEDEYAYIDEVFKKYNLAKAYFAAGEYDRAGDLLQPLMQAADAKAWVFDLQGRIFVAVKSADEALKVFGRALHISRFSYIYQGRAQAWLLKGAVNRAVSDLHDALRRDRKGKHKILLQLARIEMDRDRLQDAENYIRRAIDFKKKIYDADYAEAHLALAELYRRKGDTEQAKKETQTAYSISPYLEWENMLTEGMEEMEMTID